MELHGQLYRQLVWQLLNQMVLQQELKLYALVFAGGASGPATTATEEWTGPSTTLNYKTLTTS
jgi:hypothetical protein